MERMKNKGKDYKTIMDVQKFLKIFSGDGIIFQPLNEELQEADVEQVYDIQEVDGIGTKFNGLWVVQEV